MEVKAVYVDGEGKKEVDGEGKKEVESILAEVPRPRHPHTIRHIEKKLVDKGALRLERHPVDGLGGIGRRPPKSGHGGKFTWEGPEDVVESEMDPVPPAMDEKDPNYVEDREVDEEATEVVVGEVEVAKVAEAREGVARVEILPPLQP